MDHNETLSGALRALASGDLDGCTDYLIEYRGLRRAGSCEPLYGDRRAELIDQLRTLLMAVMHSAGSAHVETESPLTAADMYPGRYKPGCEQCGGMGCDACYLRHD